MTASVRISAKCARELLDVIETQQDGARLLHSWAVTQLRAALRPRRSLVSSAKKRKEKRRTNRERMAECRRLVFERAQDACELWFRDAWGEWTRCESPAGDLEHAFAKRSPRDKFSPERTLALCRTHHGMKTNWVGGAELWRERYRFTFEALGLTQSARDCEDRRHFEGARATSKFGTRKALSGGAR